MSAKSKGTARENQLVKRLRSDGWTAMRAPASLGAADIIALKRGLSPRMIQVKANSTGGAYKNFGPAERAALGVAAWEAGAEAWLVWWPADRGGPRWFRPSDWPIGPPAEVGD